MAVDPSGSTLTSGKGYVCVLEPDGRPVCWGGQSPPQEERFISISSGEEHACGLRANGSAVCWGNNGYGRASPPNQRFSAIASGNWHTCALQDGGRPVCWGADGNGQGSFPPGERFEILDSGRWHVCALRSDGSPVCWGEGDSGQTSPPESGRFIAVSGGRWHTCALRPDGVPVCWGVSTGVPPLRERFTSISSGEKHTCGLRADGRAVCWGNNDFGQTEVPESERFVSVSSGYEHTCGLRSDGSVVCWGRVDQPPPNLVVALPKEVPLLTGVEASDSQEPDTPQGQCSAYDPDISWLEEAYTGFSICYTQIYRRDLEFVARWVNHAKDLLLTKYEVSRFENPYTRQPLHVSIMLLPEADDHADTSSSSFQCCYDASGQRSNIGAFGRIPYLAPSHRDWDRRSRWGTLQLPPDDYHAKVIVHEVFHAGQYTIWGFDRPVPQWVHEGLAEYEGMFNSTEHNKARLLDSLVRYFRERIPDSISLETSESGKSSITASDIYFGGSLILTYLADWFGEDIHSRLVWHQYDTFDEAMAAEFEAAGTTTEEVFNDLRTWIRRN